MPKRSIVTEKELAFLRELVRNRVPFLMVGLSAAALQGTTVVTEDIDLWFKDLGHPGIRKALDKVDGEYVPPMGLNPPMFAGESVELFDIVMNMDGLDGFEKEYRRAMDISLGRFNVKVLPLDRIIRSKQAAGRPKDRSALRYLKHTRAVAGEEHRRRQKV